MSVHNIIIITFLYKFIGVTGIIVFSINAVYLGNGTRPGVVRHVVEGRVFNGQPYPYPKGRGPSVPQILRPTPTRSGCAMNFHFEFVAISHFIFRQISHYHVLIICFKLYFYLQVFLVLVSVVTIINVMSEYADNNYRNH